jgi:hypothetical protein
MTHAFTVVALVTRLLLDTGTTFTRVLHDAIPQNRSYVAAWA